MTSRKFTYHSQFMGNNCIVVSDLLFTSKYSSRYSYALDTASCLAVSFTLLVILLMNNTTSCVMSLFLILYNKLFNWQEKIISEDSIRLKSASLVTHDSDPNNNEGALPSLTKFNLIIWVREMKFLPSFSSLEVTSIDTCQSCTLFTRHLTRQMLLFDRFVITYDLCLDCIFYFFINLSTEL